MLFRKLFLVHSPLSQGRMALSSLPGDACSPLTNLDDAGSGLPAGHWTDPGGAMEATRAGKGGSRLIARSGKKRNRTLV